MWNWAPLFPAICWVGWNWAPLSPAICWVGWNWAPLFPAICWVGWNWAPLFPAICWVGWNWAPLSPATCWVGWNWAPLSPAICWAGWNWAPLSPAICWAGWNWAPLSPAICWAGWNWAPVWMISYFKETRQDCRVLMVLDFDPSWSRSTLISPTDLASAASWPCLLARSILSPISRRCWVWRVRWVGGELGSPYEDILVEDSVNETTTYTIIII